MEYTKIIVTVSNIDIVNYCYANDISLSTVGGHKDLYNILNQLVFKDVFGVREKSVYLMTSYMRFHIELDNTSFRMETNPDKPCYKTTNIAIECNNDEYSDLIKYLKLKYPTRTKSIIINKHTGVKHFLVNLGKIS